MEQMHCPFCEAGIDTLARISQCPTVLAAYDAVSRLAALPPLVDARRALMLQEEWDGAAVAGTVAVFSAVWAIRAMCRRGIEAGGVEGIIALPWKSVQCPWLTRCSPTKDKRQRRSDRVREPESVPGVVIYRSDGTSRGQGRNEDSVAGWGAAV